MKGAKPVILVVEDDESLRRIAEFNLTEAGHRVYVAADGDEGLERALRKAWPRGFHRPDAEQRRAAFAALARKEGVDAARAILRILVDTYRGQAAGGDAYGEFFQDEDREVVG